MSSRELWIFMSGTFVERSGELGQILSGLFVRAVTRWIWSAKHPTSAAGILHNIVT